MAENTILLTWVDDPGTFILGCIAAVGTNIGAVLLYNQWRQADRLETFRSHQKHKAQRALMPLRPSEINRYVEKSMNAIEAAILQFDAAKIQRGAPLKSYDIPILEDGPIIFFSDYIEFSPNNTLLIEKMISMIQYQNARLSVLTDKKETRLIILSNLYYYIEYCILQSIINSMYDYGRGRSDDFPCCVSWDIVMKNISFRDINGKHRDEILKSAQRISKKQGENVDLHQSESVLV